MLPTHILFDFFGTLVEYDTSPIADGYQRTFSHLYRAGYNNGYDNFVKLWTQTYAELETQAKRSYREFSMTDLATTVLSEALGSNSAKLREQVITSYLLDWNESVTYIPGLKPFLAQLSQAYTLGVITNTHDTKLVPMHLQAMQVDGYFRTVVTSVELGIRKPHRDIFDTTLARLNVGPDRCIYVGDNYDADYCGATAAGLRAYLIHPEGTRNVPESARLDSVLSLTERLSANKHLNLSG
jgi:putative hydrolase of the HAD superfamily